MSVSAWHWGVSEEELDAPVAEPLVPSLSARARGRRPGSEAAPCQVRMREPDEAYGYLEGDRLMTHTPGSAGAAEDGDTAVIDAFARANIVAFAAELAERGCPAEGLIDPEAAEEDDEEHAEHRLFAVHPHPDLERWIAMPGVELDVVHAVLACGVELLIPEPDKVRQLDSDSAGQAASAVGEARTVTPRPRTGRSLPPR